MADEKSSKERKGRGRELVRYSIPLFFVMLIVGVCVCAINTTKNARTIQCFTPWAIYNFMLSPGFFELSVVSRPGSHLRGFLKRPGAYLRNSSEYWDGQSYLSPEENKVLQSKVLEVNKLRFPRIVRTHRYYVEYQCRYLHAIIILGIMATVSAALCYWRLRHSKNAPESDSKNS